jgi:hypothetical protein
VINLVVTEICLEDNNVALLSTTTNFPLSIKTLGDPKPRAEQRRWSPSITNSGEISKLTDMILDQQPKRPAAVLFE